jgi:hypothetical protein
MRSQATRVIVRNRSWRHAAVVLTSQRSDSTGAETPPPPGSKGILRPSQSPSDLLLIASPTSTPPGRGRATRQKMRHPTRLVKGGLNRLRQRAYGFVRSIRSRRPAVFSERVATVVP